MYLTENNLIKDLSWVNIKTLFTTFYARNYHPLVFLTYALEYYFFELEPHVYHTTNLSLHILNTLLVFWFIFKISDKTSISLVSALLFGIHPLHVESVAWVAERKDVLSTFFFLQSLIFYLIYKEKNRWALYYLSLFVFILSLLSKPMVVTLPVVLLLCDYFFRRKFNRINLIEKIPFFILSIVFGIANIFAQLYDKTEGQAEFQNFFNNILIACWGIIFYLIKIIAPFRLSALYPYPLEINILSPVYFFPPLILVALTIVIYYSRRWTNVIVFGSLFFIITILPVLQLIHLGHAAAADRYMYIPSIGLFYIAGVAFHKVYTWEGAFEKGRRISIIIFLCITISILSSLTYQRNKVWQNSETLWSNVLENNPDSMEAHNGLGNAYMAKGHNENAIAEFKQALDINPNYVLAHNNLALVYKNQGLLKEAIVEFNKAIQLSSNPYIIKLIYENLGTVLAENGDIDKAIIAYKEVIKLDSKDADAHYNLGSLYGRKGLFTKATKEYLETLKITPNDAEAHFNLGITYLAMDLHHKALHELKEALRIRPDYMEAKENLEKAKHLKEHLR